MSNQLLSIMLILPMILITSLMIHQNHLLMSLLMLEGVMLSLILMVPSIMMYSMMTNPQITVIMLTMSVVEASLGLSLLVMMSRKHGSDMMKSLTINKC